MITILYHDITTLPFSVDIIVNAANSQLMHGGGVAKAIAEKAGKQLEEESRRWIKEHGPVPETGTAITSAGNLKAKWVIHAVGPKGTRPRALQKTIQNIFTTAKQLQATSIALPAISCGIYGFDKEQGAAIIYEEAKRYEKNMDIYLVSIDSLIIKIWKEKKAMDKKTKTN